MRRATGLAFDGIHRWSALLLCAAASTSTASFAQSGDGEEVVEEIMVTGSRLAQTELNTSSPVTMISAEDVAATGMTSVGEILRELPVSGGQNASDTAGRGNSGIATIALRGLSAVNTLVLMNGRRMIASDDQGRVDLNSVPFTAIDRIEVLQDGASAIYGVDAIAGVVNLIMKESYDGLSIQGNYGISDRGDADVTELGVTFGLQSERGGFVFAANHREQNGYLISDRPCCRDADERSLGGANLRDPIPVPATVVGLPGNPTQELMIREGVQQATSTADFRPVNLPFAEPGPNDGFNWWAWETSMSDSNINNVWFAGHYDITEQVEGFAEISFNQRKSRGFFGPDGMGAIYGDEVILDANNDYNPFGVDLSVTRIITEAGKGNARQNDVDATTSRLLLGLRGGTDWKWELSANSQRLEDNTFTGSLVARSRIRQAAGDSDACRAAGNGCVPVNLLGAEGTITPEMLRFLTVPTYTNKEASLDGLQFNITGSLFSLPAGEVQAALGAEYREEGFDLVNDLFRNTADIIFVGTTSDAHPPLRRVKEVYAEASVPILDSLDLDTAVRYSDFNQFGTTTNPKIGIRWRPFEDWLFRGSYGTGFRAPTFNEAYAGQSRGFRSSDDPCRNADFASYPGCNGLQAPLTTGTFVIRGGNPNLDPETAKTYTLGVVWTPSAVEGLAVRVDAYRLEKEDVIQAPDINYIIRQNALNGSFGDLVSRDSLNRLDNVIAILDNIGTQEVAGYDLGVTYRTAQLPLGKLAFGVDLTYVDEFASSPAPGIPSVDRVGTYTTSLGTVARVKANGKIQWQGEKWIATYTNRYVDGVTNLDSIVTDTQEVDAYFQHDLSLGYELDAFDTPLQFTLGVENLLDEGPPFIEGNTSNGFDSGTFTSRGRYFFMRASVDVR